MDITEENMSSKEMLEKIAELDYGKSLLKDSNAEMRRWLDVADDDIAVLRSENASLRTQVNVLEKVVSEAQQDEAEPCRSLLVDNIDVIRCSKNKIHELEKECTMLKEQNKELTAELKKLHEERDQDKINLNKLSVAKQKLEFELKEAELVQQRKDEIICQKTLESKYLKESLKESTDIIEDLRLTKQELRRQLEDRLDEASFNVVNDQVKEHEASLSRPLSFAEEIMLLASSTEVESSTTDSTDLRHEEPEAEELLNPHDVTADLQIKRCADTSEAVIQTPWLFMLCIFILTVLAFVASVSFIENSFSINTLWNSARLILQPYCSVQYGALPPI